MHATPRLFVALLLTTCQMGGAEVPREQILRLKEDLVTESSSRSQETATRLGASRNTANGVNSKQPIAAQLIASEDSPQVISLDVKCNSNSMDVLLVFSTPFRGIVYSKGRYSLSACHYVKAGRKTKPRHVFRIDDGVCGTRFTRGANNSVYMENIIVIQNEPTLQKAADTARKIRCLLRPKSSRVDEKVVSYAFNVDTLDQKEVVFESDDSISKANAVLDIQLGQGPYAPSVDGLVKIGDVLTMVVEAEGEEDVDVRVRQCVATNGDRSASVNLTDEVGCTMKPNLLSPWLKMKQERIVMAYSYFSAFKFPEEMDVIIECNLDLCQGACGTCEDDNDKGKRSQRRGRRSPQLQEEAPGASDSDSDGDDQKERRRRSREPLLLARRLRVVAAQDVAVTEGALQHRTAATTPVAPLIAGSSVCLSVTSFVSGLLALVLLLFVAAVGAAVLCIRVRTQPLLTTLPESAFHAFSTVSGKP